VGENMAVGKHIIIDMWNYDESKDLKTVMRKAAEKANMKIIGEDAHQFEPQGESIVILIAESHISIHTWPERSYAAVDVFSCGAPDSAYIAAIEIIRALSPEHYRVQIVDRG